MYRHYNVLWLIYTQLKQYRTESKHKLVKWHSIKLRNSLNQYQSVTVEPALIIWFYFGINANVKLQLERSKTPCSVQQETVLKLNCNQSLSDAGNPNIYTRVITSTPQQHGWRCSNLHWTQWQTFSIISKSDDHLVQDRFPRSNPWSCTWYVTNDSRTEGKWH